MSKSGRKLHAYRGRLSPSQIADGINAALKNACRLAEDAETLLTVKRFPTAASLAILAIEETGKISILRGLAVAGSDADVAKQWRQYRSHTEKNAMWILPQLVAQGARKMSDLKPLYDESSDHPFTLDLLKQVGFYTDCLGQAHWSVPTGVIDEKLATVLVGIAKSFALGAKECCEKEIELWIKHLGPVWYKQSQMEQGLIDWYEAMQEAGLVPSGINEMDKFINQGFGPAEGKPQGNQAGKQFKN